MLMISPLVIGPMGIEFCRLAASISATQGIPFSWSEIVVLPCTHGTEAVLGQCEAVPFPL